MFDKEHINSIITNLSVIASFIIVFISLIWTIKLLFTGNFLGAIGACGGGICVIIALLESVTEEE